MTGEQSKADHATALERRHAVMVMFEHGLTKADIADALCLSKAGVISIIMHAQRGIKKRAAEIKAQAHARDRAAADYRASPREARLVLSEPSPAPDSQWTASRIRLAERQWRAGRGVYRIMEALADLPGDDIEVSHLNIRAAACGWVRPGAVRPRMLTAEERV